MVFKRGVSEGEHRGLLAHLLSLRLSFEARNTLSRTPCYYYIALTAPLAVSVYIYLHVHVRGAKAQKCSRTNKRIRRIRTCAGEIPR